jgi:hypothetical protein
MRWNCGVLLGGAAIALATAAQAQNWYDPAFQARERNTTERLNRQQFEYHAMRRAHPHYRWRWFPGYGYWPVRYATPDARYRDTESEASARIKRPTAQASRPRHEAAAKKPADKSMPALSQKTPAHPAKKLASLELDRNKLKADTDNKPLTPAEIRTAVSLDKLENPKQALSNASIRSLWGDPIGHVSSVDTSGNAVKSVEADVGGKTVRLDPAHLKYVKSRNLLVTAMSKADVEKLPKGDRS